MKRNDFGFPLKQGLKPDQSAPVADDRMAWGEAVFVIQGVLERVKLQQKLNNPDSDNPTFNIPHMNAAWERILQG